MSRSKFERRFRAFLAHNATPENVDLAVAILRGKADPCLVPAAERHRLQCFNPPDRHTLVMIALDAIAGTCGVEYIGPVDMRRGPPLEYLNTGDTYAETLLWFRDFANPWRMGSWGDYAERFDPSEES